MKQSTDGMDLLRQREQIVEAIGDDIACIAVYIEVVPLVGSEGAHSEVNVDRLNRVQRRSKLRAQPINNHLNYSLNNTILFTSTSPTSPLTRVARRSSAQRAKSLSHLYGCGRLSGCRSSLRMAIHRVSGANLHGLTALNFHLATMSSLLYATPKVHSRWISTPMFRYVAEADSHVRKTDSSKRVSLVGVWASTPYRTTSPQLSPDDAARLLALLREPHSTPAGVLKRAIADNEAPLGVVGKSSHLAGRDCANMVSAVLT